jgi:hypothetical protein
MNINKVSFKGAVQEIKFPGASFFVESQYSEKRKTGVAFVNLQNAQFSKNSLEIYVAIEELGL